jgi:hypothetical protein
MTDEVTGSARLVLGRVHNRVNGRFAVAIRKDGEGASAHYNVFYSDLQKTDTHVSHKQLQLLKREGYHVIISETTGEREHEI